MASDDVAERTAPRYSTAVEWQAYALNGQRVTQTALAMETATLIGHAPCDAPLAIGFGALCAVGEYLRVASDPNGVAVLEQMALAYLRGAIRGADGPVRDNGQPFTGALDA